MEEKQKPGPPLLYPVQTAIKLTTEQHEWLKAQGGQSETIRKLIDAEMRHQQVYGEPEKVTA
jgi:hypothetical protein